MDYGKVFTRAWEIIWKNRVLWIFGILASCGSGGGGGGGSGNFNVGDQAGPSGELPPELQRIYLQIERFFENTPQETIVLWVVGLVCVALLIGLLFWAISVFGRLGVIRGAVLADAGTGFNFGSLASESWARLGGALWMNFLLGLIPAAVVILLVIIGALFAGLTMGVGLLCLVPVFCILVPFFIAYSVYIEVANVAYVSEGLSSSDAISKGWDVFRNNLGSVVVMALILFVGGILASIVLALPFVIIAAPAFFGVLAGNEDFLNSGLIISAICLVLAIPILVVANGILQSYIHSAWTLAYAQMSGQKPAKRKASAK